MLLVLGALFFLGWGLAQARANDAKTLYLPLVQRPFLPPTGLEVTLFSTLSPLISGHTYVAPVAITHAGDERLFVVGQGGAIHVIGANGVQLDKPFLDISSLLITNSNSGGEQGLLGLAFHPNYKQNGYFYVSYTEPFLPNDPNGNSVIMRYEVSAANPNVADPSTAVRVITIGQPSPSHNAGDIHFGPDGYLYFSLGDGTSTDFPDPFNNSQNPRNLLGKMLRIDVDKTSAVPPDCNFTGSTHYSIPADNPFVGDDSTCSEIWASGLRNPWRFSFDAGTGDLFIGDVGYHWSEEINRMPAGVGGWNFGWRCFEGLEKRFEDCRFDATATYRQPVFIISSDVNTSNSITGGVMYRGKAHPQLHGYYIFGDFSRGDFYWMTADDNGVTWSGEKVHHVEEFFISAFGVDQNGEIYVADWLHNKIYRVVPTAN